MAIAMGFSWAIDFEAQEGEGHEEGVMEHLLVYFLTV